MAHPSHVLTILLMSLAMATSSFSCPYTCENEINWRLYLKQVGTGPDNNQDTIVAPPKPPKLFGTTVVNDWTIIDAPALNAKIIGHAQGVHVMSDLASVGWYTSLNIVFQGDRFNGSTLQVMGVLPPAGEWAIVGGTGELALARGTIKHKIVGTAPNTNFRELDIHAFYLKSSICCKCTFSAFILLPNSQSLFFP
ncbi:jasmonate-induced protein [Panicum miliaceum]|uniref:Dirigent protein n=1 Tax=Panicum miliaceum TaxID=4540 RepID=A0A3L6PM82_PANMI|nr:jasmonate-induced protein [Panicum miliaceum]